LGWLVARGRAFGLGAWRSAFSGLLASIRFCYRANHSCKLKKSRPRLESAAGHRVGASCKGPIARRSIGEGGKSGGASDQDRSAINHQRLPSAESFLHQEQISLRYVGRFANSGEIERVPLCVPV
jgi:hypothetical protein